MRRMKSNCCIQINSIWVFSAIIEVKCEMGRKRGQVERVMIMIRVAAFILRVYIVLPISIEMSLRRPSTTVTKPSQNPSRPPQTPRREVLPAL